MGELGWWGLGLGEEAEPLIVGSHVAQVYSNTPETINLIIEVFVEVAHKQICYLGEVSPPSPGRVPRRTVT